MPEIYNIIHPSEIDLSVKKNHIFIYPTETFYAIGCYADESQCVTQIYELKKRSLDLPLLVLVDSWDMLFKYATISDKKIISLLEKYWPGPLTAILTLKDVPNKQSLSSKLNQHNPHKLAFRITSHPIAKQIITLFNTPIVGTSANITGFPEITDVQNAVQIFNNQVSIYIDGGLTKGGKPSTLIDCSLGIDRLDIIRTGATKIEFFK